MSNVKSIYIVARVPFDWLTHLGPTRRGFLASWLLAPATDVRVSYQEDGYEPNDHGGRTAMYTATFHGAEAMSWDAIDLLKKAVEDAGGDLVHDGTYDMEAL